MMVENRDVMRPSGVSDCSRATTTYHKPKEQEIQQQPKLQEAGVFQGNSKESSSPGYLEVTFLNKICHVYLSPQGTASTAAKMVIQHFGVNLELIQEIYLIHIPSRRMLDHDEHPRPYQPYFIAFKRAKQSRKPYRRHLSSILLGTSNQKCASQSLPLLSKRLFNREGRSYIVKQTTECEEGLVQELHLHQARGNPHGFVCPVITCGAHFKKSCDLVIHFHVETGCKPYKCAHCKQAFRRNILLKKHVSRDRCPVLRFQRLSQIQNPSPPTRHHSAPLVSNALVPQKSLLTHRSSPDPPSRVEVQPLSAQSNEEKSAQSLMLLGFQLKQMVSSKWVQQKSRWSVPDAFKLQAQAAFKLLGIIHDQAESVFIDPCDTQAPQHSLRHFLISFIQLALNMTPPILIKLTDPSIELARLTDLIHAGCYSSSRNIQVAWEARGSIFN